MIICLEGPDLAGKSTLAKLLVAKHEREYGPGTASIWKEGPPPEGVDLVAHYEMPLLLNRANILSHKLLYVLDRWETGELAYGPLLRGRSGLSVGQALHVDLLLRSLGASRILVMPSLDMLHARYDERGDDLIQREWLSRLSDFYANYCLRHHWDARVGTDMDDAIITALLMSVAVQNQRARWLDQVPGFVGWPDCEVLLVGEKRSNWPARPGDDAPAWGYGAFTPAGSGGSSRWLLDSLEALPEKLPRLGLCNAIEYDQSLEQLWHVLDKPAVVALGNVASNELTIAGIEHHKIPHPQWAKRFRNKHQDEYVQSLKEGIVDALDRRDQRRRGVPEAASAAAGPGNEQLTA